MLLGIILYVLTLVALVLCLLLLWVVFSPVPFGLRWAVENKTGLKTFLSYRRVVRIRRFLAWPIRVHRFGSEHLPLFDVTPSMRVVIDQRLTALHDQIDKARTAIEAACEKVGQFGQRDSAALMKDISDLEEKTKEAAKLGGAIDEDLVSDYQVRKASSANLVVGIFFLLVFAIANGLFMNQFMRSLFTVSYFGVPVSFAFSLAIVAMEAGAGFLIGTSSKHGARDQNTALFTVSIVCVLILASFEAGMIGLVSYSSEFDVDLFKENPLLRFWMAPIGVAFSFVTAGVSYSVHKFYEERCDSAGALMLRREIRQANAYVRDLPLRWQSITHKAREAKNALSSFSTELGARDGQTDKDGAMSGLLAAVDKERAALIRTLDSAKPKDWAEVVRGTAADDHRDAWGNLGLLVLTAMALYGGFKGMENFLVFSLSPPIFLPLFGWIGIAVIFILAFYSLGFMAFQRLQNVDAQTGRADLYRSSLGEKIACIAIAVIASVAVLWCGWRGFGTAGLLLGLVVIVGGGLLAMLGYHFERSCRAVRLIAFFVATWVMVLVAAATGFGLFMTCWSLVITFWVVWTLIRFLGLPTEIALTWWAKRRPREPAPQHELAKA